MSGRGTDWEKIRDAAWARESDIPAPVSKTNEENQRTYEIQGEPITIAQRYERVLASLELSRTESANLKHKLTKSEQDHEKAIDEIRSRYEASLSQKALLLDQVENEVLASRKNITALESGKQFDKILSGELAMVKDLLANAEQQWTSLTLLLKKQDDILKSRVINGYCFVCGEEIRGLNKLFQSSCHKVCKENVRSLINYQQNIADYNTERKHIIQKHGNHTSSRDALVANMINEAEQKRCSYKAAGTAATASGGCVMLLALVLVLVLVLQALMN